MKLVAQPQGSSLCGQCCVAMAAGVSLTRAKEIIGHDSGTTTREVITALRALGLNCADRMVRPSRQRPNLPARAILAIHRPKNPDEKRLAKWHWMLTWDGVIYDPDNRWPDGYQNWKITSYLEILP